MRQTLPTALIALASAFAGAAWAAPVTVSRDTVTGVAVGAAGTFAGASFTYDNTMRFDTGTGNYGVTLNTNAASRSTTLSGLGASIVSPATLPDGVNAASVTVTGDATGNGGWQFSYVGDASGVFGESYLTNTIIGGRYALAFDGGGFNLIDTGGVFTSTVVIEGDWSDIGSHTALSHGAGYTLLNDFSYDLISNKTTVKVQLASWDGTNPDISFALLGARVLPEPGVLPLAALALLGAAFARRRVMPS